MVHLWDPLYKTRLSNRITNSSILVPVTSVKPDHNQYGD